MKKLVFICFFISLSTFCFSQDLTLFFQFDKSELNKENSRFLVDFLQTNKPNKIILKGYADTTGSTVYNKTLAQKRIETVEQLILSKRKDIKIEKINFGEENSFSDDANKRKVEIFLIQTACLVKKVNNKKPQTFLIDNQKDTTIICASGTKIRIPQKSLIITDLNLEPKGNINFEITEYYEVSEMIDANLITQANNEILETGGMLYLQAFSENKKCQLKNDSEIEISFKDITEKDSMQIYSGNISDSYMNWEQVKRNSLVSTKEEMVFFIVEDMPTFLNGDLNTFRDYVTSRLRYPGIAQEQGIQGDVLVQFTINKYGLLVNPKIVRSVHPSIDSEVLRAISNPPNWKPGKQRGKPVAVQYTMPFKFALDDGKPIDKNNRILTHSDFENYVESDSVIQRNKKTDELIGDFYLRTNKLGWINCDRFYRYPNRSNIKVHADSEFESYFAVFNDLRSIMQPRPFNSKEKIREFENIPVNQDVIIVGIKISDKNMFFASFKAKADGKIYKPDFVPTNKDALSSIMKEIGL